MATDCVIVTCAAVSPGEADRIARALVEARLAACVQVGAVTSHYRWQAALHAEPEWLLQAKTTTACLPALEALVTRLHSYDLPEIVAVPVVGGSATYLAWLRASVTPRPDFPP